MLDPAGSSVQVTHNLCKHLAAAGCDVHVFTAPHWVRAVPDQGQSGYKSHIAFYRGTQLKSYDARNVVTKLFWRAVRFIQHAKTMFILCAAAKHFDVVHTQILPIPLVDAIFLHWISRRTPLVCTVHELVPHSSRFRRVTGAALNSIYRQASILFAYTKFTRERLIEELGIHPSKILIVPHGTLEHLLEVNPVSSSDTGNHVPIILFIGNIRRDKGLDVLIDAVSRLRDKFSGFKLKIAGSPGYDMAPIRTRVASLHMENLTEFHLEYLDDEKFVSYMRDASVVALPYRRIEQSGVAIAACTLGKAIVATRCGGVGELVMEAGNGLLVPMDNASAFAEALEVVLFDDSKRRLFERRSREYANRVLSWQSITLKTLAAYQSVLKQNRDISEQLAGSTQLHGL